MAVRAGLHAFANLFIYKKFIKIWGDGGAVGGEETRIKVTTNHNH